MYVLSPEIWEESSQKGIHDQCDDKVIAKHTVMDKTYR